LEQITTVCSSQANIFFLLCFALISVSCGKGSIERGSGNSETDRSLGDGQISFEKSAYRLQVLRTEFGWPPTFAASSPCRSQAGKCPFADEVSFEFRQSANTWNTSLPAGDLVSILSVNDSN